MILFHEGEGKAGTTAHQNNQIYNLFCLRKGPDHTECSGTTHHHCKDLKNIFHLKFVCIEIQCHGCMGSAVIIELVLNLSPRIFNFAAEVIYSYSFKTK